MLSELQSQFDIAERIAFFSGQNGLTKVLLRHPSGSECEVYLQGATVTSWKQPSFGEILYLSPKAQFAPGKAIRGGIPLIFPQFGGGPLPSHGFARTAEWRVAATSASPQQTVLSLELSPNAEHERLWPHTFRAEFRVELSTGLRTALEISNLGKSSFEFQNALHTYFLVGDIAQVDLPGLAGCTYLDNTNNRSAGIEERERIRFDGEIDRIYQRSPAKLTINDGSLGRSIIIQKRGMNDSVVWNPWIEKARTLSDLPDEDYTRFVCVESGNMVPAVSLPPDTAFECSQEIWVQARSVNGR